MRLSKSARYALYAAAELAAADGAPVTVAEVAAAYRLPTGALAKVFQQLVRAGIAAGTRGVGGGYRLARRAKDVTVLDVIRVYETPEGDPEPESAVPAGGRRLARLFREVDELVRCTFASVSLQTLVARRDAPRP
ncbi:MAG: Rrf2 family transcriptional regulator [Planctomycetes bacterium]|nr:Rrf2 family transcriptional regulator [Planctomycetota bacterium]